MKHLVGRSFFIADGQYRIVDVRRISGDALVYAERVETACLPPQGAGEAARPSARTAFHYGDIVPFLQAAQGA